MGSSDLPGNLDHVIESLPFSPGDVTAGTENELQALVIGKRTTVDLPISIERSRYYSNILKRVAVGEASTELVREVRNFLSENDNQVWENSWVRFPRKHLSPFANDLLDQDLKINSSKYQDPRSDRDKFVFSTNWGEWVRVPISYLIKLSLADVVGAQPDLPSPIKRTALDLLPHFSNDLTSPETFSFNVVDSTHDPHLGVAVAREMAIRSLFTHLMVEWANKVMKLESVGQQAKVNFAPHPAVRQRELNNCVSDAFYRELFVSPCLSGWDDGEAKHQYMLLAHQIISRSQINAVVKLREAGIITNNLVVLPNSSSVSLANNGTHLSLGSKKITNYLSDMRSGFKTADAKSIGDLVIKICEHFLPLFVGTYTAAPYRLGFSDFYPERALGFLAHLFVRALYSPAIERPTFLTSAASSRWASNMLSMLSYSTVMAGKWTGMNKFLTESGVDLKECVEPPESLDMPQKVFERQINFWESRPLPDDPVSAVCPADARVIVGSLLETSSIFIKEKFFDFAELLSTDRLRWLEAFAGGDFAVFRLTPEKYHYVHVPASGQVVDFYNIDGRYHSCNPQATVSLVTPYSKNRRVVTILQTGIAGGSHIGLVAIIEVVALIVGGVVQRYSDEKYEFPRPLLPGMFLKRGQPKSLFRPGSSTVIVLFQRGRVEFARDLICGLWFFYTPAAVLSLLRDFRFTLCVKESNVAEADSLQRCQTRII